MTVEALNFADRRDAVTVSLPVTEDTLYELEEPLKEIDNNPKVSVQDRIQAHGYARVASRLRSGYTLNFDPQEDLRDLTRPKPQSMEPGLAKLADPVTNNGEFFSEEPFFSVRGTYLAEMGQKLLRILFPDERTRVQIIDSLLHERTVSIAPVAA